MADSAHRAAFLSYAREDTDAARRLADALRGSGIEVWFDQAELRGGEAWDAKIKQQIRECALFVPLISAATQARGEGYFRREWKLAVERTHDMAHGMAFVFPVVIDQTAESEALAPEEFMRVQWTRLKGGEATPELIAQVKRLLENPWAAATAGPRSDAAGRQTTAASREQPGPRRRRLLFAGCGALAVLAAGAAGFLALRPGRRPPEGAAPGPAAVAPAVSNKSIAVLPFENMSEEKDSAFFADGIHEDVLTNLSFIRDLRVVSRTSVMQYRGTTKPIKQIAGELGVAYILEGSVRRAGNRVRVTGQLIRAATDEHVWAKAYDRDLTDIFAIQGELAQAIAGALQSVLSSETRSLLDRRPTDNPAAYDLYLKARQLRNSTSGSGLEPQPAVVALLQDAVRLDPGFAAGWGEFAAADAFGYFNGLVPSLDRAKQAIDTAVRLAPEDPAVIEDLGTYYYYGFRDYERAAEQYLRLAQLRPNDGAVCKDLALIQRRQGRWAESIANFRRALELDPTNVNYTVNLIGLLAFLRRYEEAEGLARRFSQAHPQDLDAAYYLCTVIYAARGSTREMEAFARRAVDPAEQSHHLYLRDAIASARGDGAESLRLRSRQRYFDDEMDPHWLQDIEVGELLAETGAMAACRARVREALALMGSEPPRISGNVLLWAHLGVAHALLGEKEEALRCTSTAAELLPESRDAVLGPEASCICASAFAWIGQQDRALAEIERLLRTPFGINVYFARGPGYGPLRPLRGDPRFRALLADPKNNQPLF